MKALLGAACAAPAALLAWVLVSCASFETTPAMPASDGADAANRALPDAPDARADGCAPRTRRATVVVYRPLERRFYWRASDGERTAQIADIADGGPVQPLVGDWDGDGRSGVAIFEPASNTLSLWDVVPSGPEVPPTARRSVDGYAAGCRLVVGRFRSCGTDEIGICCPVAGGTGCVLGSSPDRQTLTFGAAEDRVFFGDWDGDGIDSPAAFRSATGQMFFRNANDAGFGDDGPTFAADGGVPLGIDVFDGEPTAFGLQVGSQFTFRSRAGRQLTVTLGSPGDIPLAGAL